MLERQGSNREINATLFTTTTVKVKGKKNHSLLLINFTLNRDSRQDAIAKS